MQWDRMDICEAYYRFAADWHGGQTCPIYRYFGRLVRMGYRPGPRGPELNDNSQAIYDNLVKTWAAR
tara:strand:- start:176 stop:376 length:201 start_codon:yes stop_codon:yes gene_type:complete